MKPFLISMPVWLSTPHNQTRMPMLIKDLQPAWPPPPAVSNIQNIVKSDPRDVVASVENKGNGKLGVNLYKPGSDLQKYLVTLIVPENVLQKTLFSIVRKSGITLGEVGELPIQ